MDLRSVALAAALATAAGAGLWSWGLGQHLDKVEEGAKRLEEQRDRALEDAGRNLTIINQLKSTLEREREDQAKLRQLQGELRAGLASRERLIESLKHENEELRTWADQPLPDAARRMRERPAITGAAAYRQWLSGSGPVPTAGDGAVEERPVAQ